MKCMNNEKQCINMGKNKSEYLREDVVAVRKTNYPIKNLWDLQTTMTELILSHVLLKVTCCVWLSAMNKFKIS